jgi:hypothetical protein
MALSFADHQQVRNKKLKDAAAAEAEMQEASKAEQNEERGDGKNSAEKADILGDEGDKDVIF